MAGLLLALIGDVNNVDIQDNMDTLMRGLMIAVVAYSCYWTGMWRANGYQKEDLGIGIGLFTLVISFIAYIWKALTPQFRIPVIIYALNMSMLVWRAASCFYGDSFTFLQCILMTTATSMMYLGDVELGIQTFKTKRKNTYGAFLYAGGQLLLGLAPSYFVY